ncbi:MAG TPA: type I DNA topoisomerase, partial [bacterium]|nr:type I DNA topoisomerase [bacterium]
TDLPTTDNGQDNVVFRAFLVEKGGKPVRKMDIKSKVQAEEIKNLLTDAKYSVLSVETKKSNRKPSAPFVTSTLQMEASRRLGYSAKQTMMLAQKLYEAGHITYMRTDSTSLSVEAVASAREAIKQKFGQDYLPATGIVYQTKSKRAQEAHEAIRPTHFDKEQVSDDRQEQRLYDLVWKRTLASQMKEAIFEIIEARIEASGKDKFIFLAKGERMVFDGFIRLYAEAKDDESEESESTLPKLENNEDLRLVNLIADQKYTEPPKRFTEAMLVKKLESLEIGRPSTYAPTLSTIQDRGYVTLLEKKFSPTEIGEIVTDLLVKHFPKIVDYQFTANMENDFDEIASGERKWVPVIKDFYVPFEALLREKTAEIKKDDIIKPEETSEVCPECGKPLVIRLGRYGKFFACSGFPECKYSRPLENKIDPDTKVIDAGGETVALSAAEEEKCEKCGGKMVLKEGRFGAFLACENYPKCKNTKSLVTSTGMKCPECGEGEVIERRTKRGKRFWGCSRYPGCKYASWENPNNKAKGEAEVENGEVKG